MCVRHAIFAGHYINKDTTRTFALNCANFPPSLDEFGPQMWSFKMVRVLNTMAISDGSRLRYVMVAILHVFHVLEMW